MQNIRKNTGTASSTLSNIKSFNSIYIQHKRAWKALWDKADIKISGDRFIQKVTRLHIYHLLVSASLNNKNIDAGITARGLHGEAYRGHVFWDELFIFPFFNLHFPEITRALLMYRYNRLEAARKYAHQNGYEGAMYPWQSADDGNEETQEVHFNPKDGSWGPDLSRLQRHVSIAVFFNIWNYIEITNDKKFLREYGAEIMLEITRFWASIAVLDSNTGKYHIQGVMGPDEFHEKLPGSDKNGLKDNAYTNIMVVWLLEKTLALIDLLEPKTLEHLIQKTGFMLPETEKWQAIINQMNVGIDDQKIISQFEGYMDLKELDWDAYRAKYDDIHRLDRILKSEGVSPDNYKVSKQADVLRMFYVLGPEEVGRILNRLGCKVPDAVKLLKNNYEFYKKRTSHGSTLSKVVHAIISSYTDAEDNVWEWFKEAMASDIFDTQGGTTIEGIHCGVMAGTLDIITRYFAGIDLSGNPITINPHIPKHWHNLAMKICYQKTWYHLEFTQKNVKVRIDSAKQSFVKISGQNLKLQPGKTRIISIS